MGWITLTDRKEHLNVSINNYEVEDLGLSRELRATSRNLCYQENKDEENEETEIEAARAEYDELRENRPKKADYDDINAYQNAVDEWQEKYNIAKEDFEERQSDIESYYDDQQDIREGDSTRTENNIQQRQTLVESEIQSLRAELESIAEQIGTDVKQSAIQFN